MGLHGDNVPGVTTALITQRSVAPVAIGGLSSDVDVSVVGLVQKGIEQGVLELVWSNQPDQISWAHEPSNKQPNGNNDAEKCVTLSARFSLPHSSRLFKSSSNIALGTTQCG